MERQGGSSDHQNEPPQQPEASSSGSTEKSSSTDQNETTTGQKTTNTESNVPPPNSFSFKHFLKDSGNSSTASASVRPQASSSVPSLGGARPKIPHYSLLNGGNESLPRMKRSPKFPSFDSHASLAEYSEEVQPNFVQRSHSNYEVESPLLLGDDRRSPADVRPQPSAATSNRNNGEFSAALPDFVKDHLVLEQWFQSNFQSNSSGGLCSNSTSPPPSSSSQQPPVLGLDNSEPTLRPSNRPLGDNMPFDLMFNSNVASSSPTSFRRNNSPTMPLDLPPYDRSLDMPHRRFSYNRSMASSDLPLDLTETRSGNSGSSSHSNLQRHFRGDHDSLDNDAPPQVQADMIQTLPDFLSDGPIHSSGRLADVAQDLPTLDSPEENSSNIISRLRLENDRLRHELDETRRQLSDQSRQKSELERTCRNSEIQRNGALLEKNKLLQKITQMTDEIERLKRESDTLKDEDGAVGGNNPEEAARVYPRTFKTQQISRELLKAAFNAESNLRKLLSGVDNLRLMAKWIEHLDEDSANDNAVAGASIEDDPLEDYPSDDCDDHQRHFDSKHNT